MNYQYITRYQRTPTPEKIGKANPLLVNVDHLLVQYSTFTGTGIKIRLTMRQTNIL